MTFNYARALDLANDLMDLKTIEAVVLGQSGAGKSYVMGSFGVPTLYLYSTGESHGPRAAKRCADENHTGSTIFPICMDLTDDGQKLEGDAVLARIVEVLSDEGFLDACDIRAVVIDGAAELETYIRGSDKYVKGCESKKGEHNSFAEPAVTVTLFRPVFNCLKDLQRRRKIHFAMTAMLDVKEYGEYNDVAVASPRLKGFQVAEMLIQQFGDVLVVGPMKHNSEIRWKFQFMTDLNKASKDLKTGVIKRSINFNPRLQGPQPPPYVNADFRELIKLRSAS